MDYQKAKSILKKGLKIVVKYLKSSREEIFIFPDLLDFRRDVRNKVSATQRLHDSNSDASNKPAWEFGRKIDLRTAFRSSILEAET